MITIAPDKIGHLKAGALAAGYGALLGAAIGWLFGQLLPLDEVMGVVLMLLCAAAGSLASASSAGITKEKTDEADNVIHPGMHMVELADAAVTTGPGVALAAVLGAAAYMTMQGAAPWMA